MIGLIFVIGSRARGVRGAGRDALLPLEVVIVVSIQAFIFAALSAIYIGSAIEPNTKEAHVQHARVAHRSDRPAVHDDAGRAARRPP